ncbi:MAG: helix-hairpin-helix domain-containing protein [Chloroflexi bacterium]|nr:helix-hairpin-helix domain-containing protein [Chloroflexota bacterium]
MINYLKGIIRRIYKDEGRVVIDVKGVGYELLLPYFVMRSLEEEERSEGDEVEMEIYFHVSERQPRPVLVGFRKEYERTFFEKLIQVEDVGVSTAARALVFSISTIARAIEDGDTGLLVRMPGIGKRTADKMVATLRGKVAEWALLKDEGYTTVPAVTAHGDVEEEVVSVLVNLGHRRADARQKVEEAAKAVSNLRDAQELLREVFRLERGLSE